MSERNINVRLRAMVDQYRSQMQQAAQETRRFGSSVADTVRQNEANMTRMGIGFTAVGAIAAAGFRAVIQAGGEFQASMNQVAAVSGATGDTFDALSAQARELGATTKFSAGQAADAMYFLSSAGFDAMQVMDALPGVLQLAAAGNMDLATTADIASNILSGYALDVSELGRVNDVLAMTFKTSNTNIMQAGEAMKYVAPVAAAAGLEFEEAAAAIGLMGNAGIQASMAGTSLRGAITRLLAPSQEAASLMSQLGLNAVTAEGGIRPLHEIIDQLAVSGATTGEMMLLFGQRAGPAMAALVSQGADALRNQTQAGLESAGTAAEIAEIQMQGFQGAMVELGSALEGLKIALFESGAGDFMEGMVRSITGIVRALESMPAPVQAAFMGATGLVSVVGLAGGAFLLLAPRIVATKDAMSALAVSAPRATGAMRGMGRFIAGPWGVAMAGAVVALLAFSAAKERQRQRIEEIIATLDDETGALTTNTRAHVVSRLEKEDALDAARRLGLSLDLVTNAAMGDARAQEELARRLREMREEAEQSEGRHYGLRAAIAAVEEATQSATREIDGAVDAHGRMREAMAWEPEQMFADLAYGFSNTARAADDAVGPVRNAGEAYGETEEEVKSLLEALNDLHDEWRAQTDPVFAVQRATQKLADAKEKVAEVTKDEKATAEDIRKARLDEVQAAQDLRGALEVLFGSVEVGITTQEKLEAQMRILMRDFGLSEESARELIRAFQEYDAIAGNIREAKITVDATQAMATLRALQDQFARIRSTLQADDLRLRAGTGQTPAFMHDGGMVTRFHDGGGIGGGLSPWGSLRQDEVPIIAQTGEWVLSRGQVAAVRDIFAGAVRMHSGGQVQPSSGQSVTIQYYTQPSPQEAYEAIHMAELAASRIVR